MTTYCSSDLHKFTKIVEGKLKFLLKPFQNKKNQKSLKYLPKKQSFSKEKDCSFVQYLKFFWPFLYWSSFTHWLYQSYYARKMQAQYWNHFWAKNKVWHPWKLKKLNSWGPFWSYQLNSKANSAHFAKFFGKWAKLAVLFAVSS